MIKKSFIIGVISMCLLSYCHAQQEINYTMFMFNKLAANPAYAGSVDALRVSGHYRNQWTAFKGAPENFTFSAHSNVFSDRTGAGITLTTDRAGIVREHIIDVAYAYKLPLDRNKKNILSIGLSGAMQYKRINWNETNPLDEQDPELSEVPTSHMNPNFGVGVYLKSTNYYAGISVPRIFLTNFYSDSGYGEMGLSSSRTVYMMGGYVQEVTPNIKFQPGVLMTVNGSTPFEMDLNASFVFIDRIWIGLSYRLEDSMNGIFQVQITDQVKGAIAVDVTLSELSGYAPVSFEFMAQYTMHNPSGHVENIRFF